MPPGYLGNDIQEATSVLAEPRAEQTLGTHFIYFSNLCQPPHLGVKNQTLEILIKAHHVEMEMLN